VSKGGCCDRHGFGSGKDGLPSHIPALQSIHENRWFDEQSEYEPRSARHPRNFAPQYDRDILLAHAKWTIERKQKIDHKPV
jgi:hypothetical protein